MTEWKVPACLQRAGDHLMVWRKHGASSALVYAALELRLALELYLLGRVEEITGQRPVPGDRDPIALLDEALQLHDEAMTPQGWSVGVSEEVLENPVTAPRLGFAVLTARKARAFYSQLTALLHGTVYYHPEAQSRAFWEKQAAQLTQIHAELAEICLGTGGATRVGPHPETGGAQGAVL